VEQIRRTRFLTRFGVLCTSASIPVAWLNLPTGGGDIHSTSM
jgi:hypothetical protein